jgi:hypothetical protein
VTDPLACAVSKTTKLTPGRTGATHGGQRETARTPHQSPTAQGRQDRPATGRVRRPSLQASGRCKWVGLGLFVKWLGR